MNHTFMDILTTRRSVRKYKNESIPKEKIEKILQAGLISPSGRNRRPWELIVVEDKEVLKKLSVARDHGASMLEGAGAAIIVFAKPELTDVWTEDCCIVMSNMHLMATALGVGSCWIQGRLRVSEDGRTTEDYIKELLGVPENYKLEAMLSLGIPDEFPEGRKIEDLPMEKVHWEHF